MNFRRYHVRRYGFGRFIELCDGARELSDMRGVFIALWGCFKFVGHAPPRDWRVLAPQNDNEARA